ncbi:MAG TPA: Fic family protein [Candidatus Nanoarchaeia archaeon]|nr:Fic family protein [Candidatus Nanoarchaeia archaeon]
MVYLYKKIIQGKPYYYLRISKRAGKRIITKDIAYLGNSISQARKKLDNLSQYKDQIRKSYNKIHKFLESNHYLEKVKESKLKKDSFLEEKKKEIEACKLHFNSEFRRLDSKTKQEIYKHFVIEFSFNSTSIEGNTITLKQARDLLEEGKTPKNRTLREIFDLQNQEEVFFDLLDSNDEIDHRFIQNIHKKLMKNIDKRTGYRTRDVRVIKAGFKSTPAWYVKTDMDLLLDWYKENKNKLHPFVLAVGFHHKFEKIHPFMDGNGRTGRMIMNYILMKNKYPPVIIKNKLRQEYLDALKEADNSNLKEINKEDYIRLVVFVSNELVSSYWDIFL